MATGVEQRVSSQVARVRRLDRWVYIKRTLPGAWGMTPALAETCAAREAEILDRLALSNLFGGRLGLLKVVDRDRSLATVVTEEAPGETLDAILLQRRFHRSLDSVRALYLAGKWLRTLQRMEPLASDELTLGDRNPADLVEYCQIRLNTLMELRARWLTQGLRARIVDCVARLVERSPAGDTKQVLSHHDYQPCNLLWDGRTITAIDFTMYGLGPPLLDATHFAHRIELLPIQFPWRRWPTSNWIGAFLRGYGRPEVQKQSMYKALQVRHMLCRLQSLTRRPPKHRKQQVHNAWVRARVRGRLFSLLTQVESER